MKKKFTRLALILGLTGVLCVNTFAATFTDVNSSHWAYAGISYMQDNGYMTKNSSGQFLPNETVSYFEFSEILAKMTGYQDKNVVKDMDEKLKQDIDKMYAQQLPYIQQYDNANKYKTWKKSSNEEISYILARGYMTHNDLSKFMIKSADGKEMQTALQKQDLARYLVFYMGKANTAKEEYEKNKTTGFADESLIRDENKPYVAYLKTLGVVKGDANGKFGANDKVTRALAAAMTTTVVRIKEANEMQPPVVTPPTTDQTAENVSGKVYNIVPRNNAENETLILVEVNGKNKFYTANASTQVVDAVGNTLTLGSVKVGDQVSLTVGANDMIKKVQLQTTTSGGQTEDKKEIAYYKGEIDRIGRAGDLSIYTSKGIVTFDVDTYCAVLSAGQTIDMDELGIGDTVNVKVENDIITEIELLEKAKVEATSQAFVKVVNRVDSYYITVTDGKTPKEMAVDKDVKVYRDNKSSSIESLFIGDQLTFTSKQGKIVEIEATSTQSKVEGDVTSILISNMPEVVVSTREGDVAIAITPNTEIYDSNTREDGTIRNLQLGMKVEVRMESKEATSLVIKKGPSTVKTYGTIEEIGPGARYIDILVEYDQTSKESMVIKRINVPTDTIIEVNGKEGHRKQLKEDMEVRVTFNYGDELYPVKIEILD